MTGRATPRLRPTLHFTPSVGWINDPHGVIHDDERYHLFFQHNPTTTWTAAVEWGHATSDDLLGWQEQPVALRPEKGEVGCWTGSVVIDDATPTILYTRIVGDDWEMGQVALVRGGQMFDNWRRDPQDSVIDSPPADLSVGAFRDPFVWRVDDGWRLLMAAGTRSGVAMALQYRSSDLRAWTYDGVLAQRASDEVEPLCTGTVWECPQLFPLDGTWVLVVSVFGGDVAPYVAYALGDYDGLRFHPRTWGRFSHGDEMYATTAFVDAEGRRCVMSWIRERVNQAPPQSPYTGAISLPYVLAIDGDLLNARPHPNLAAWRTPDAVEMASPVPRGSPILVGDLPAQADVVVDYTCGPTSMISLVRTGLDGEELLRVTFDGALNQLAISGQLGEPLVEVPLETRAPARRMRLIIDADILELVIEGLAGVVATRVAPAVNSTLTLEAEGPAEITYLEIFDLHRPPANGERIP